MFQDKDRRTCFLDKPYSEDNLYSVHIPDDKLRKDHLDILRGMYRFHCHNVHLDHKETMHKDQLWLVQL